MSSHYGFCKDLVCVREEFKHPAICPECGYDRLGGYHRISFISDYVTHRIDYHHAPSWKVYDQLVTELKAQGLWDDCRECYDPCGGNYYRPHPCCGTYGHKCGCKEALNIRNPETTYHVDYKCTPNWTITLPSLCPDTVVWPDTITKVAGEDLKQGERVQIRGNKVYKDNRIIINYTFFCGACNRYSDTFKNIKLSWPNGPNGFDCSYCGWWNHISDTQRDEIANSMRTNK